MRGNFRGSGCAAALAVAGALIVGGSAAQAQYSAGGGTASGTDAIAIGDGASASSQNSVAVGYYANAGGLNAIAIGTGANASTEGAVALGGGSIASRGGQTDYEAPYLTAPQTSGGEVSVGNDTFHRQITNVAAGSAPTDAVNVAQLQGAVEPLRSDLSALSGRVGRLEDRVDDVRDIAISAGAIAMANSQLRYDDRAGKLSLAAGGGAFHGKGAFAVGLGFTSPDRLWRANVSGSFTEDEAAFGGGMSFTLN
jgi:autotransporter adhesin